MVQRRNTNFVEVLNTESGKELQDLARLRSCACLAASLWLDTLLMPAHLQLTVAEFVSAMRSRLGLVHTSKRPCSQCWCGWHLEPGDASLVMTCKSLSGAIIFHHDILKEIWRYIWLAKWEVMHP